MTSGSNPSSILLRGGTVLTHDEKNHVISLFQTDVLVRGNLITEIGKGLSPPIPDTEIIDCIGKIVSPGFVDTHHHLWQTQLKGRHVNQGLVPYMYAGKSYLVPQSSSLFASRISLSLSSKQFSQSRDV